MLQPGQSASFVQAVGLITPKLVDVGAPFVGQRIGRSLKEMWINGLNAGGHQARHHLANRFMAGQVYLTPTHPGSQAVFTESPRDPGFTLKNDHTGTMRIRCRIGKFANCSGGRTAKRC